ncbi:MAG: primosomal protein N' [Clostridia bacterium]|nr:primosomal protein N' [Clostridia bacterium]
MLADVRIIRSNSSYDINYTYVVPDKLKQGLDVGVFVDVPFGAGNKTELGIVTSLKDDGGNGERVKALESGRTVNVKEIAGINLRYIPLGRELLALCDVMAKRYVCTAAEVYKTVAQKRVQVTERVKKLRLAVPYEDAVAFVDGTPKKKKQTYDLVKLLAENPEGVEEAEAVNLCDTGPADMKRLTGAGIIVRDIEKVSRLAGDDLDEISRKYAEKKSVPAGDGADRYAKRVELTQDQSAAARKIKDILDSGAFGEFLLRGVTGSGKTEVYFDVMEHARERGKGAILLVPEIALTEQMIRRVRGRFGDGVAIIHSRLGDKQRACEYERMLAGEAKIVLGVRSAVFAPVKNLGLIIVDEEQEPSYKSFEQRPYYNANEVAAMRMKIAGGTAVYGSATPRVTTYYRAQQGKIGYTFLSERAQSGALPEVITVDMKAEIAGGLRSPVSPRLAAEIAKNIEAGEQTIVFIPRRGHSARLVCLACGKTIGCRYCHIPVTYHKSAGRLICHYCGTTAPVPSVCPNCGSRSITGRTYGTEAVADEISALFPGVPVLRMDNDTTRSVDGHRKIIERFENEKVPVLVGTQMVAKGLDFPNVTLVGVINADSLANMSEYNASERAFQLLTQVFGRAGRTGEKPGRCVLQTLEPNSSLVADACAQDYGSFYRREIAFRQSIGFPPFSAIAFVTVSGKDDRHVFDTAAALRGKIVSELESADGGFKAEVMKVTRTAVPKIDDRYFWRFAVRSEDTEALIGLMNRFNDKEAVPLMRNERGVYVSIDIDA